VSRPRALALFVCCLVSTTPVFGATLTVTTGGSLQAAIDAAQPGDTIVLQAGATFTGPFTLRAKNGTAYITIRSSTADSLLPPAGTRITPAHSSLLAKIRPGASGSAIRTVPGASYWRLQFLEILPSSSTSGTTLVEFGSAGTSSQSSLSQVPHHLVIDRCYVHGNPSYGYRRGLALNSADSQVLDSHFSDFKASGVDSQAILGWNGPGPYLIQNNHLEASGENVMFGGGDPVIVNLVPSNITIRRNLFTKPAAWKTQGWTLINLLELKNAQNMLVEGNIFENNWLAAAQGYAIAFTPRNQDGTAPWSVVRNITFQNNVVRHVGGVFNITGYDDVHPSRQTEQIVIRNNLAYDVSSRHTTKSATPAPARFMLIGAGPKNIFIRHNTADNDGYGTILFYKGESPTGTLIYGFELTSNLLRDNRYGIFGDAVGGEGAGAFNAYTPGGVVLRNAIGGAEPNLYPVGNDYPPLATWLADFVDLSAADYRLKSTSLSKNAATDGTDIGVDFTELNAALAGSGTPPPPPPPPPTGPTPYSGTAVGLPGTVQAEHYDRGGEGIAYHDTTAGNKDGVLRSDDVDLQTATDTGGGYKVKSAVAGEWLKYSVNVAAAGSYTITVRVASVGAGGTFHIEANGVDKTGPLTVPDTGGWQSWRTLTKTGVTLAAGSQILRLVLDSNGPSGMTGNFNWIAAAAGGSSPASTPYSGTPIALPGTIQAENYDRGGEGVAYHDTTNGNGGGVYRTDSVDLQDAVDTGGGYKVKTAVAGEWLKYTVNVSAAGTYTIAARVTSSGTGGTFHIEVNGVDKTGPIAVPNTGGWQAWRTLTKTGVALTAGEQVIRLVLDTNGTSGLTGNFNWIAVQ
jgi:Carbohydrate binding module (family 6)